MSENKIKPRGQWVLVMPADKQSQETEQGLTIPTTEEREQKAKGVILNIGTEIESLKIGDEVIFGAFAGENIKTIENGKEVEYKLLMDEDIIAIIE